MRHRPNSSHRRLGGIAVALLVIMPLIMLAVGLALRVSLLHDAKIELQKNADATALAAASAMVDDRWLLGDRASIEDILDRSWKTAEQYADGNLIFGQGVKLEVNPSNSVEGDMIFGTLDFPRSKDFFAPSFPTADENLPYLNTVRVQVRRLSERKNPVNLPGFPPIGGNVDLTAAATAVLDHHVVGFRPVHEQAIPLMPVGLLSDPTAILPGCWESQVPTPPRHRKDGITRMQPWLQLPVVTVRLSTGSPNSLPSTGCYLKIGALSFDDIALQIQSGVTPDDLTKAGLTRGIELHPTTNTVNIPGTPFGPTSDALVAAFQQLVDSGEARVFPLFTGISTSLDLADPLIVVSGFVAARVILVERDLVNDSIVIQLRPAMISVPSALTDPDRKQPNGATWINPYICKIRLVE